MSAGSEAKIEACGSSSGDGYMSELRTIESVMVTGRDDAQVRDLLL